MTPSRPLPVSLDTLLSGHAPPSIDLSTLLRIGSLLNSTLDPGEVLRISMEEAARAMDAEASSVLLLDPKTGDLVFEVATGAKGDRTKELRLRPGEGVAGWVVAHNTPVRIDDAQVDPRFTFRVDERTAMTTRSILCVPLRVKDRVIGVLEVINKSNGGTFTDEDEELLMILSHQIATAIDNAQLYRRVYEEKETLRAVLDSMADGVIVVDSEDRVLLHNPAMLAQLGVEEKALSIDRFGDARLRQLASRLGLENRRSVSFNLEVAAGAKRSTLANTATVLSDPAGKLLGAVMVMRDITERARLEKMKNDFIATTSHKLRTPLTSILSFATLLGSDKLRRSQGSDPEALIRDAAEAIEEQGRYLHELIEKLLAFSAMEMESPQIDKESVDLVPLLEEACRTLSSRAGAKSIRLNQRVEIDPARARMDRRRILTVLVNLIENAVKFSPPGTSVTVGAQSAGRELRLWVEDEGNGIPEEEQERIFEKFYQIDRDVTGQVEGAGLGLTLCKDIVCAHGGRITVDSAPGRGSTFSIYLPIG